MSNLLPPFSGEDFVLDDRCIFDREPLLDAAPEHIILNALGGTRTTRTVICRNCNGALGREVDQRLAEAFAVVRNVANVRAGDGDPPPTLRNVALADGERVDFLPGFKPLNKRLRFPPGPIRKGYEIEGAPGVIQAQLPRIAERAGLTPDEFVDALSRATAVREFTFIRDPLRLPYDFGGPAQARSVAKAALVFLADRVSNAELATRSYDRARTFVRWGTLSPGPPVARLTHEQNMVPRPSGYARADLSHCLAVWATSDGKTYAFYQLFGHIDFAMDLGASDRLRNIGYVLWRNPVMRRSHEAPVDVSALPNTAEMASICRAPLQRGRLTTIVSDLDAAIGRLHQASADDDLQDIRSEYGGQAVREVLRARASRDTAVVQADPRSLIGEPDIER